MKKQISVVIFLALVLSKPKKLLHIVGNKIKRESRKLVKKLKNYSKSKNIK